MTIPASPFPLLNDVTLWIITYRFLRVILRVCFLLFSATIVTANICFPTFADGFMWYFAVVGCNVYRSTADLARICQYYSNEGKRIVL
jgi:hypothetical protein